MSHLSLILFSYCYYYHHGEHRTHSMTVAQWLDVEESKHFFALEELEGGNIAWIIETQNVRQKFWKMSRSANL